MLSYYFFDHPYIIFPWKRTYGHNSYSSLQWLALHLLVSLLEMAIVVHKSSLANRSSTGAISTKESSVVNKPSKSNNNGGEENKLIDTSVEGESVEVIKSKNYTSGRKNYITLDPFRLLGLDNEWCNCLHKYILFVFVHLILYNATNLFVASRVVALIINVGLVSFYAYSYMKARYKIMC